MSLLIIIIFTFAYGMVMAIISVLHTQPFKHKDVRGCLLHVNMDGMLSFDGMIQLKMSLGPFVVCAFNHSCVSYVFNSSVNTCMPIHTISLVQQSPVGRIFLSAIAFFGAQMFELRDCGARALRLQREVFHDDVIGFCIFFLVLI